MLHRRDAMLRLGQYGLGALTLPGLLAAEAGSAKRSPRSGERGGHGSGKAKSCILVFLWGGPPQQDLWDMKPDAPAGIRSQFAPIRTRVPGIDICDQMPRLAKHTDKLAIIRSVTHPSNEHEAGVYHMLTGKPNPRLRVPTNHRTRSDFPNVAGIVSYFTSPGAMPASVTLPTPVGHDGVTYAGTHAGFLGPRYDPLELKAAHRSTDAPFPLAPPADVGADRVTARHGLLKRIELAEKALQKHPATSGLGAFHEQALRIVASPLAKKAFDITREPAAARDRYGRNPYGEAFLLCRRLVEAGVRLVTFTWLYVTPSGRISNVWDNHGGIGDLPGGATGYGMLRADYCIPPLDRGLSALLEDLHDRGMLDETLVAAFGEMGRTPKINAAQGRDHWGAAQSVLLAGGSVRGGQVYGATDRHAAFVKDNPVRPEDLLATVYHAMGILPDSEIHDREHRPYAITEGKAVTGLFG
jgi:hypothetical protein